MINADAEIALDYLLSPEFELINSAGKPLTGGYIEVYIHGTRNKYYCYEDWNGTLHPFQIPLDSIGSNVILASPENAYDVYVYNKFGSLIMSRYNVHCQGGNGGSSTYVGDKLFYGQYRASNVTTIANLRRNKGNINLTSNGYLKLKNGMSYHITVRGAFQVDDVTNIETTLNYIEYTSVNPIKIDIDETKEGPQYFELSYDIYRLPDDMDYQVAFAQSNGMVTELLVEVHSLSNLATSSAGGDQEYEPGWGIDITNNVISVDPSILDDYVTEEELLEIVTGITGIIPEEVATHTEVYEATVTAIEYVTGMIPQSQIQSDWDETNESSPAYIQNKPDLDIYATHDEVNTVSGQIIEVVNNVSGDIIETVNNVSGILHGEIENIPAQQQADWDQSDDTQVDYIKNKPDLSIYATHDEVVDAVTSIDLSEYATHTEVYDSSVTAIQLVTGLIPDVSDFTTHDEVHESIVSALEYVTGIIPDAQVQSDWTESDTTDPAYIKHKPNQTELVAGQNIGIFDNGSTLTIAASGTDLSDYTTFEDVIEIVSGVTGLAEYGQFYASEVYGHATMARTKGTIETTQYGDIKLKKGSSYHVTVRGRYNQTTPTNVYGNISYVEYITGGNININVDKSITESQYFEISYDLYKLNSDTNYQVSFTGISNAAVNDLYIEIHAIGSVGVGVSGGAATEYDAGWGIQILNNVISVNPSILNDYVTENELVSAIQSVVTAIPSEQVQSDWAEDDTADPAYIKNKPEDINLIAGTNIGIIVSGNDLVIAASGSDLSDYATLEQLQDSVELVTGLIPDTSDLATKAELQDGLELVTGLIPTVQLNSSNMVTAINNYPIYSEGGAGTTYTAGDGIDITNNIISVDNTVALKTDIPEEEEVEFEEINLSDYALASAIPDVTDYATHAEVNNVSGAIVGLIPELPEDLNLVAGQNIGITISGNDIVISASVSGVSGYVTEEELIEAVTAVTAAIPAAQVQSDWNETNVSSPAYIQNKPTIPSIEGLATVAQVSAVSGYLQSEIDNIPAQVQSDWAVTAIADPAYIQNKPDQVRLVAGQNITIVDDTDIVTISASVPSVSGYVTDEELQDAVEFVTGLIPDTSDMATQTWVGNQGYVTEPQVTALIPDSEEVEFEEIDLSDYALASAVPTIQLNGNDEVISINNYPIHSEGGGGTEYTAGDHIGIVNDEISVTGITELVAGNAITITTSGVSAIISSTGEAQVQSDWDVTDSSSKAYIKNKPTIPAAQVQSNWNETNTSSKAYIQNKPTIHNYTGASGVTINNDTITLDNPIGLVAGDNITIEVSGVSAIISAQGGGGGGTTYTAGQYISINSNDVIAVTGLDPLPDSEEVDFEELDLANYALASAIPAFTEGNCVDITSNVISWETTAGITDIQLVNALPGSPVSSVLYLIPET